MNIEQIIGWAYSYACNLVDKGIDIRTIEAPTMLDKAKKDIMDNRPLTEEILEELGFGWNTVWNCYELEINGIGIGSWKTKNNELAVKSIIKAGEELGLRCPMDGEYKIGRNWSETH